MKTQNLSDRLAVWPLATGMLVLAWVFFVMSWPVAAYAFSLLCLFWAIPFGIFVSIVLICALWSLATSVRHKRWRRALSVLAFPVCLALCLPTAAWADRISNEIHFALKKNEYLKDAQST